MEFIKEITKARYNIGFIDSSSDSELVYQVTNNNHVRWLDWNGYKGGWFADPFILSVNDSSIEVLVEEWNNKQEKGRISKLVIDKASNKLQKVIPLLENNTHFSFPYIWRDNGKVFVCPENYQSGGLFIYEYDNEKEQLINPYCLIDEPLLDAQLVKYKGEYNVFAVRQDNGSKQCKLLYVYKSSDLMGDYKLIQTIENALKEERGAGTIINYNNHLIRPVQSCEVDYGYSMVFYELVEENGLFSEKEIGRMFPNTKERWNRKIHTYNEYNNLIVVDGYEYVHRFLSNLYRKSLRKLVK